jgi:two-component system sensor histidine kinase KdpD
MAGKHATARRFPPLNLSSFDAKLTLRRVISSSTVRYLFALLVVALTTMLSLMFDPAASGANIQLFYILSVLVVALIVGFLPALLSALLGFLCFRYFFVAPTHVISLDRPQDVISLAEFFLAGCIAGLMAVRERAQARRAERQMHETLTIYSLAYLIDEEQNVQSRLAQIAQVGAELLNLPYCAIFLTDPDGHLRAQEAYGSRAIGMHLEEVALEACGEHLGRLQIALDDQRTRLTERERNLLDMLATQVSESLERARLLELAGQAKVLAESDRLKSALLSSVIHSLRPPVGYIKSAVAQLKSDDQPAELRQQLIETVTKQSDRLQETVSDLIDLSRIRAGALQVRKDRHDVEQLANQVVDYLRPKLGQHALRVDVQPELPAALLDRALTEQVLIKLLDNAIEHTPRTTPIALEISVRAGELLFCVSDRGPGLPPAMLAHIFDPFSRPGRSSSSGKSGMGLAICQGFTVAQGGRIWAESQPGVGARFCFTLPQEPAAQQVD